MNTKDNMDIKLFKSNTKFKLRVSGIIVIDNKLLVTEYGDNNTFCLPGGYAEIGETTIEATKREMLEELQTEVEINDFLGIIENFYVNFRNDKTQCIEFYYNVSIKKLNSISKNDFELEENDKSGKIIHHFRWLELDKLDTYNLKPNIIKKYIGSKNIPFHLIQKEKGNE